MTSDARTERLPAIGPRALLCALGLLAAIAIALLATRGEAATGSKATGTLNLVVEFDRHANARDDVAPAGDSAGDQVSYSEPVYAADNRTRLGRALLLNTFYAGQNVLVNGALRLRDGTITLAGALSNGSGRLAVTGGTGAYAGARGTYNETAKPLQVLGEDGPSRHRARIVFTR